MIITFYSYKGGTGRTMVLANIAALLAMHGKKVLAVDMDLEAPGLWRYFSQFHSTLHEQKGMIELLANVDAVRHPTKVNWRDYVTNVRLTPSPNNAFDLSLITGGAQDRSYPGRVLTFDWERFFERSSGGDFFDNLRTDWTREYDFVLIDSRTGITDVGGVCTIMLPDLIVAVFSSNMQNLDGIVDVIARAQEQRRRLAYDRTPVIVLPILSRFESRFEFRETQDWLELSADKLKDFYSSWLPDIYEPQDALRRTFLPYVPYFSFGERLPSLAEGVSARDSLGSALNSVTQLIESHLQNVDAVMGNGDATEVVVQRPQTDDSQKQATPPVSDRSQDDGRAASQIAILGASASGKTTFVAALPIALARLGEQGQAEQWSVTGADDASRQALVRMTEQLTFYHTFPTATALAIEHYRWQLTGQVARRRRLWFGQFMETVRLDIDIADTSGELADPNRAGSSSRDTLIGTLTRCRGLVLMFDPINEFHRGETLFHLLRLIAEVAERMTGLGESTGRLPHYVAVCISKFDDDAVTSIAEELNILDYDDGNKYHFPRVPDDRAQEFFIQLSKVFDISDPGVILRTLENYFHRDRIRYFVTSAVGFYVDPKTDSYDSRSGRNEIRGRSASSGTRIRGSIHPVNVAEPFLWLSRQLASTQTGRRHLMGSGRRTT